MGARVLNFPRHEEQDDPLGCPRGCFFAAPLSIPILAALYWLAHYIFMR